jgi:zinc transporter ZupT
VHEKLVAGIVTAAGVAPICALCVLGPAAIGSALAGAFAWLNGAGPFLTVILTAAAGLLIYRTVRRRHTATGQSGEDRRIGHRSARENSRNRTSDVTHDARLT